MIYFYGEGLNKNNSSKIKTSEAWEYYDLEKDPLELKNEFYNPTYKKDILKLRQELIKLKDSIKDYETTVPEIVEI